MNNGEMVEFDSPKSLMSNKKEFFSLAQESGLGNMNSQLFL
jgi:ABC-type multidrug transport system fused ATPase/permease subunit